VSSRFEALLEQGGQTLYSWAKCNQVGRIARRLNIERDEARALKDWLRAGKVDSVQTPQPEPEAPQQQTQDLPYWHDRERDVYVLTLKGRRNPVAIRGDTIRSMREAYSKHGGNASINELTRKFGMSRPVVVELLRRLGITHDSTPWTDDELGTSDDEDLVEDLLRRKEERVLVRAERREWSRIKKDADAFRRLDIAAQRVAERFEGMRRDYKPERLRLPRARKPFSLVLGPSDLHHGKYGPGYTGDGYDRETTRRRLFDTTARLLDRVADMGAPERIYCMLGSDGMHVDNIASQTTRGTPQQCDGTVEEVASTYIDLWAQYVDLLRQVAPVVVHVIPGNHDQLVSTLLRAALVALYRRCDDVTVDASIASRQWVQYGSSLLVFLHGDLGKARDWIEIVSTEARAEWGETDRTYVFCGHLHTERQLPQRGGSIVYRLPSLAGTDAWHHRSGYVGGRKALQAFQVDRARGVVCAFTEPAEP
jgi:hypothetical protein